jgi:hypothetical protein
MCLVFLPRKRAKLSSDIWTGDLPLATVRISPKAEAMNYYSCNPPAIIL